MRYLPLLVVLIAVCISPTEAVTEASAYTMSNLTVGGTDFCNVLTLSDNFVSTPDLYFKGVGDVISNIKTNCVGGGQFSQGMYFSAESNGGLSGMSATSNAYSWRGVTEVKTSISGTVSTNVFNPSSYYKGFVESMSSGLTIASTGTKNYDLTLTGGHLTATNSVPVQSRKFNLRPRVYDISFEVDPLQLDEPADLLSQESNVDFQVLDNGFVYYGYDFSRELEIGDVNCKSEMTYVNQGSNL